LLSPSSAKASSSHHRPHPSLHSESIASSLNVAASVGYVKWAEEIAEFELWAVVKMRVSEQERLQKGGTRKVDDVLIVLPFCFFYHTSLVTHRLSSSIQCLLHPPQIS
jgi:hypothetical protein